MTIRKTRLGSKIFAFLAFLVFALIIFYTVIYTQIYKNNEENLLGRESINTLYSLETSIDTLIRGADDYSKMILTDAIVQECMESGDLLADPTAENRMINQVYSIIQFSHSADAVWLIDQKNHKLRMGDTSDTSLNYNSDRYQEMRRAYGKASVHYTTSGNRSSISVIRSYNSMNDFRSLGLIGVEISEKRITDLIREIIDLKRDHLYILDEENRLLFASGGENEQPYLDYLEGITLDSKTPDFNQQVTLEQKDYLCTGILCSNRDWKIYRFAMIADHVQNQRLLRANVYLIGVIGFFILIGASIITWLLTKPIQKMLDAMGQMVDGVPSKMTYRPFLEEFQMLFQGYNSMVERIQQLIKETIERQKRIRQVELNEIQEQMKPHFLYNTLDSIEALALLGETETVGKLIEALGGFYRKSVSGGREFLTIGEEFAMTKDYARIMKIRFGDTFDCHIHCDESCMNYLIPKLTIQPLVENSFQHGIRGKVAYGEITLNAQRENDFIHISIYDNGAGIPEEVVNELKDPKQSKENSSLGLRGTILRLNLMYGDDFDYEIGQGKKSQIDLWIAVHALKEQNDGKI